VQPILSRALRAIVVGVVALLLTYVGGFVFSGLQNPSTLVTVVVVVVAAVMLIEMRPIHRWANWLVGLGIGAGVGYAAVPGGAFVSTLLVVLIALGFAASRSLAFLSGGLIGLGTLWFGLIIRGQLECERLRDPHLICTAYTVGLPILLITAGTAVAGVFVGLVTWRRRQVGGPRD
jgi:hypothetical protein